MNDADSSLTPEAVHLATVLRSLTVILGIYFGGARIGMIFAAGVATPSAINFVKELRTELNHD